MSTNMLRLADQFPLGAACGPTADAERVVVPFGLRFATGTGPGGVALVDWAAISYDAGRQIAVMTDEDGRALPVMRHTSGNTSTSTASQDRSGPDSDNDHTQD